MSGVSASPVTVTAEGLVFSSAVSLAHNGGFASIRAQPRGSRSAPTRRSTACNIRRGPGMIFHWKFLKNISIRDGGNTQKIRLAHPTVRGLSTPLYLAQKVGKSLERGPLLFRPL
jgi:hypothetical protein